MSGPKAIVWSNFNRYSSEALDGSGRPGETKEVVLEDIPDGATELCGKYICVEGDTQLNGNFSCPPFTPGNSIVTQSCFDQVMAYHTLTTYLKYLNSDVGIDIMEIAEILRKRPRKPLSVVVNSPGFDNAYYNNNPESLVFGDGMGIWHFVSDGEIGLHELVHWITDITNPLLATDFFGASAAIHEGTSDAATAVYTNDAQIAEDFGYFRHGRPDRAGLRTVSNTATFQKLFNRERSEIDPHVTGMIYGGFWWSLFKRFEGMLKEKGVKPAEATRLARQAMLRIIHTSMENFSKASPTFGEFPDAVVKSARTLEEGQYNLLTEFTDNGINIGMIEAEILSEGRRRGFDWIAAKLGEVRACESIAGYSFGPPVAIAGLPSETTKYHPQMYKTKQHGDVPVLGHGYVEHKNARKTTNDTSGLRTFRADEINETVQITREEAFARAIEQMRRELPKKLAERTSAASLPAGTGILKDISIPVGTQNRIYNEVLSAMQSKGAVSGTLAILPNGKGLVWTFTAGQVLVAIDASNGRVASFKFKRMID